MSSPVPSTPPPHVSGNRNVILVGFMGVGKSSVGRWIARKLDYAFRDTDQWIQDESGLTIPEIFAHEGENGFRQREADVAERIFEGSSWVVSTGGGFPLQSGRMDKLKKLGLVVCLLASPEAIHSRLQGQQNRPLLKVADPLAEIRRLLGEREPVYRQAHVEILTEGRSLRAIGEDVLRHLQPPVRNLP